MNKAVDPAKIEAAWDSIDLELLRQGEKLILPDHPAPMSIEAAIKMLQRMQKAENTIYNVAERVDKSTPLGGGRRKAGAGQARL